MAKLYSVRPSSMLNIQDEYLAYCFDEACAYITVEIDINKKKPRFINQAVKKNYKSMKDFYDDVLKY